MTVSAHISEEIPCSPDIDDVSTFTPTSPSPTTHSGGTSPTQELDEDAALTSQKKKKKKKPKKSAKAKEAAAAAAAKAKAGEDWKPPVLCISRNKHWRYISSYHGPWLQLPLELLDSLLVLNIDPATLSVPESRLPLLPPPPPPISISASKQRDRGYHSLGDYSPPDSPGGMFSQLPSPHSFPTPRPGTVTPPPIDPGVFRSVTSIRRLIDEAAELSVRAASGLSAAELGMGGFGLNNSPWAAAQSLGLNPHGSGGGGRNVAMSAMRIHRLRALAVQKLAQAYKADEIASSVMVMQGGSVFDDVAERVLRHAPEPIDPNDLDAKYVHFFHEKIPSRNPSQLAESTSTKVLDELIAAQPQRLEYYRTRGIVHCFRDEYPQATKDFTYALKEARAVRKAKMMHRNLNGTGERFTKSGKRKKAGGAHTNGQAPPDGTSTLGAENTVEGLDGEPLPLHPSVLPDAPEPIEPQLLFLRGAAYLQQAVFLIESAVLKLEGVRKVPSVDGAELRLCYIENGKYGGVEIGSPDGPLGSWDGAKARAYREVLATQLFREHISGLLRKSIRDHEKFLSHFDTIASPSLLQEGDIAFQTEYAFLLSEAMRPGNHNNMPPHTASDVPTMFTTYHPLLVESHFSVLICQLMLADFVNILPTFARTAALVDGLEGYPVFLPPRSMGQAEFIEVLERLAGGWRHGVQPHSLSGSGQNWNGVRKGRLAIEAAPQLSCALIFSPGVSALPPPEEQASSSSSASASRKNSRSQGGSSSAPGLVEDAASFPHATQGNGFHASSPWADAAAEARALDCARILLAPVVKRQKERAERVATEKANGGSKKKPPTISIPLHGPRVEIILAWLGAVHLPELDGCV
ncbi:hypothetical protein DXG03_001222 [Asterophora parasitica]|uniref:Uncharacterized protein n=1 Tax=Asterophora parasitica TaxID=117018 RepID=A0A9P7G5S2_9AGAR|nr:hypothetical protein DXG03_001222 [Asterophora parasitica]